MSPRSLSPHDGGAWNSLASDPLRDTLVRETCGSRISVRLASSRCAESRAQALPNQDYALLAASPDGASVCFCVSDGVGSSYRGGFAAAYVAQRLVGWMRERHSAARTAADAHAALTALLTAWAAEAHAALVSEPIQAEGGPLAHEVLTALRDDYGSEAVFLAGRLDLAGAPAAATDASDAQPGDGDAHLLLCWVGNVTLHLYTATGERAQAHQRHDDRNRWSTVRRRRGGLSVVCETLPLVRRLIAHTDGADNFSQDIASLTDAALQARVAAMRTQPTNDDITILDLRWDDLRMSALDEQETPAAQICDGERRG